MDDDRNPIKSLNDSVDKLFKEEIIAKICEQYNRERSIRREKITGNPEVLVVQYMRFNTKGNKIGHDIFSHNWLKLNNVMYQLTGIVRHIGETMNSGHYYSITYCWENGNAFKLNDSALPEILNTDDFDTEREEAYMLVFCKRFNK